MPGSPRPRRPRVAVPRCTDAELERDLARVKTVLENKNLLPQSKMFYKRREELIEAEIIRRSR